MTNVFDQFDQQAPPQAQGAAANPFDQFGPASQFFPNTSVSSGVQPQEGVPSLIPSFAQGAKRVMLDAPAQVLARGVEKIAPMFGSGFADWATQQREATEAANRAGEISYAQTKPQQVPGSAAARTIGEIAGTAPVAFAMPGAASPNILARALSGMASGGAAGGMQPVDTTANPDFWSQKGQQVAAGGTAGAVAPFALGGAASLIPKPTPSARILLDAGVSPTPGQMFGGWTNRLEQGATSIPAVGDQIINARFGAVKDFNRSAINQALAPIGEKLGADTPVGREAIAEMAQKIGDHYNALVPQLSVRIDQPFQEQISNLTRLAQDLHPDQRAQFNRTIEQQVLNKFSQNGTMTGESFKEVESTLGEHARGYLNSTSYDERRLGNAYTELQGQLRGLLERSNPDRATELQAANSAYANMLRVQGAAAQIGAKEGIFTPAQLLRSVHQLDPSLRHSAFSRGNSLMQDYAEAGKTAMGATLPDSGTPYRAIEAAGLLGGTAAVSPLAAAIAGGAGLTGIGAYSPIGRRVMAATLPLGTPLSNALRRAAPGVAVSAPSLLAGPGQVQQ